MFINIITYLVSVENTLIVIINQFVLFEILSESSKNQKNMNLHKRKDASIHDYTFRVT